MPALQAPAQAHHPVQRVAAALRAADAEPILLQIYENWPMTATNSRELRSALTTICCPCKICFAFIC